MNYVPWMLGGLLTGMLLAYCLTRGWERLSTRRAEKRATSRLREWRQADNKLTSAFPPYPPVTEEEAESERVLIEGVLRRLPPTSGQHESKLSSEPEAPSTPTRDFSS